jgi:hypothetical protein
MSGLFLNMYFLIQNPNIMKIQIQKTAPEITTWALRIGIVILYVVFYVYKKKLYL